MLFLRPFSNITKQLFSNLTYRRKQFILQALRSQHDSVLTEQDLELDNGEQKEYMALSETYLGVSDAHRVCVLQPYIKWGKNKKRNTTPELQLSEAVALVNTLADWEVVDKRVVPLLTLQRKKLLGEGAFDTLKHDLLKNEIVSAVFVSTNRLKFCQIAELQKELGLPVYDRYSLIIHIFRQHATTVEAKLQVALAEVPYIKRKMLELSEHNGRVYIPEQHKLLLERREKKLKNALKKLQRHREVIRTRRRKHECPTVAVVGYTNAGKTSLIKALTGKKTLVPVNKLFATLDTTVHEGVLPNSMRVLFVDTIGFIQDVPETLIEPFNVTLEDAVNADVLVHVYDASHPDMVAQVDHVRDTIARLAKDKPVIEVANKCDVLNDKNTVPENTLQVSAKEEIGLESLLEQVEAMIMSATGKTRTRIRIRSGSPEAAWLYKQTTVINAEADPNNAEFLILEVACSSIVLERFKAMMRQTI